jgi:hypothetical protein
MHNKAGAVLNNLSHLQCCGVLSHASGKLPGGVPPRLSRDVDLQLWITPPLPSCPNTCRVPVRFMRP